MDERELRETLDVPEITKELDNEMHSKFLKYKRVIYEKINEFYKDLGKTKLLSRRNGTRLVEQRLTKDLRILYVEHENGAFAVKITNHKHLEKEISKYEKGHHDNLWKS